MKVYCRDCKWIGYINNLADQWNAVCEHPNNITSSYPNEEDCWYAPHPPRKIYRKYPEQKNAKNDCKDYTPWEETT